LNHQGQFPAVTGVVQLGSWGFFGDAIKVIEKAQKDVNMPQSIQARFEGTAAAFRNSLDNECISARGHRDGLHRLACCMKATFIR